MLLFPGPTQETLFPFRSSIQNIVLSSRSPAQDTVILFTSPTTFQIVYLRSGVI